MRFLNELLFDSVVVSSNQTSAAIDASNMTNASLQGVFSGNAVGTLKLQSSNDKPVAYNLNTATFTPTHWSDISGATVNVSGAGTYLVTYQKICAQYIRAVFTDTGAAVQTITTVADVAKSLASKYFLFNASTADGGTAYYAWFKVGGTGVSPALAGKTAVEIDIASGATAPEVATAIASALSALAGTPFVNITAVSNLVSFENASTGPFTPASDFNTAFTFAITTSNGVMSSNLKTLGF